MIGLTSVAWPGDSGFGRFFKSRPEGTGQRGLIYLQRFTVNSRPKNWPKGTDLFTALHRKLICPRGMRCGFLRQDQGRLPRGRLFRLRRVTWKSTPSNQRCLLSVWFLLRRNTLTPVPLRGPAPNGHPCPDGALAASLRLGPLRETCVQPAPKSRCVLSGLFVEKDQKQRQRLPG